MDRYMIAGIVIVLLIVLYAFLVIRKKHRDIKNGGCGCGCSGCSGKNSCGSRTKENNSFYWNEAMHYIAII